MNEKTIDQIEEEVLICEISDEAVEAAGTRTEIAGVWTFICTGIQCHQVFSRRNESPRPARSCVDEERDCLPLGLEFPAFPLASPPGQFAQTAKPISTENVLRTHLGSTHALKGSRQ